MESLTCICRFVRIGNRFAFATGRMLQLRVQQILHGDEEIRTLDPLLARQVLSQLSYIPIKGCWRPPALPYRLQYSTIGRPGLNHRVRDGNGCVPRAYRHQKLRVTSFAVKMQKRFWKLASINPIMHFYQRSDATEKIFDFRGCIRKTSATQQRNSFYSFS